MVTIKRKIFYYLQNNSKDDKICAFIETAVYDSM